MRKRGEGGGRSRKNDWGGDEEGRMQEEGGRRMGKRMRKIWEKDEEETGRRRKNVEQAGRRRRVGCSQPGPVGLVLNDACYGWLSQPVACKYGSG